MSECPCAILIVTATLDTNSAGVFEALGAGALDVVQTPVLSGKNSVKGAAALKFKLDTLSRAIAGNRPQERSAQGEVNSSDLTTAGTRLIVIGASAGGPAALAAILRGLPTGFPGAIVIVQHVDAQFVPLMATWLNEQSQMTVRIAKQGDRPEPRVALIAGTNDHLVLADSRSLGYTKEPSGTSYRPSIDVFFESVVRHWKGALAGVLLTGMGRDGARGLRKLRDAGWLTIAQDASTSVVYGMPKAAAEFGAAVRIRPLGMIAADLISFAAPSKTAAESGTSRNV